jgi:hypothetical protein
VTLNFFGAHYTALSNWSRFMCRLNYATSVLWIPEVSRRHFAILVDGEWTLRHLLQHLFMTILTALRLKFIPKINFTKSEFITKKERLQPSLNFSPIWIPLISDEIINKLRRKIWCNWVSKHRCSRTWFLSTEYEQKFSPYISFFVRRWCELVYNFLSLNVFLSLPDKTCSHVALVLATKT